MVDDRAAAKELDQWIDQLMDCKPLTEAQVKTLCDKVREQFFLHRYLLFCIPIHCVICAICTGLFLQQGPQFMKTRRLL